MEELGQLADKARNEAGEEAALLFETHQMMAEDLDYVEAIQTLIEDGLNADTPVILAADDLTPSETIQLDKRKLLGFVTSGGSSSGHAAIPARTVGMPLLWAGSTIRAILRYCVPLKL